MYTNIQTANTGTSASTYVKHEDDGNVCVPEQSLQIKQAVV